MSRGCVVPQVYGATRTHGNRQAPGAWALPLRVNYKRIPGSLPEFVREYHLPAAHAIDDKTPLSLPLVTHVRYPLGVYTRALGPAGHITRTQRPPVPASLHLSTAPPTCSSPPTAGPYYSPSHNVTETAFNLSIYTRSPLPGLPPTCVVVHHHGPGAQQVPHSHLPNQQFASKQRPPTPSPLHHSRA